MTPFSIEAYNLFHAGSLAFADIEQTGIKIDVPYLKKQYASLTHQHNALDSFWTMELYKKQRALFR